MYSPAAATTAALIAPKLRTVVIPRKARDLGSWDAASIVRAPANTLALRFDRDDKGS
jgi:hypothetical protein